MPTRKGPAEENDTTSQDEEKAPSTPSSSKSKKTKQGENTNPGKYPSKHQPLLAAQYRRANQEAFGG